MSHGDKNDNDEDAISAVNNSLNIADLSALSVIRHPADNHPSIPPRYLSRHAASPILPSLCSLGPK